MEIIDEKTIKLDRELGDLDNLVLKFTQILQKHANYVIVSGYVALLFGRSRGTEDVDFFMERISLEQFTRFYEELLKNGFWAINADSKDTLFSMLKDNIAIRFAEEGKAIPNLEIKFVKDVLDELALREKVKVITRGGELWISRLEMQVAYKKFVLKSPKDLEDAFHLQKLFNFSDENINKYKVLLEHYGRIKPAAKRMVH